MDAGKDSAKLYKALREVLKKARLKAGMSKSELARRSGLNRMAIMFIENGDRVAGMDTYFRMALGLGLVPSEVLQTAEEKCKIR